ncbi:hypothetical protein PF004_g24543 [Phytophthora fragariae]|uniref:Uncharacterized protein n=1 Tax=Phytophthora fragariae TaxID=53985 RepID=A0A6A3LJG8_9STRA|nr:hypothetical protein PF011_g5741 [Phytophthora fragariae]KAE9181430.1 hypothetical protein PF004_g24543 [Phytophthora fragariae]
MLVAHPCAKLVESKCSGYEKDKLRRIFSKCSKARLLHYFALSEGQTAAMLTDNRGVTVPNPDAQAGLLGQHLQPHSCG